jgi:drug/metabolite transporter (DMT)-like permease
MTAPARLALAPPVSSQLVAQRRAILSVMGAALTFSVAAAAVKGLDGQIPLAQVILCRNLFAIPALLPVLIAAGGLAALRTRQPGAHLLRALFGMAGMAGSFYGYAHLPIAMVSALNFTMPLFLTALSVPLLKERVGWRRWSAVSVGFLGVLLMVQPGAGQGAPDPLAVGMVLLAALGWALAMITIRRMGAAGESSVAIVLWFAVISAVSAGIASVPVWVAPTAWQWVLLVATGVISALAQVLMTRAYRAADSTLIAPFEYSAILWTVGLGALLWGEMPDGWDALGIAVLVGSGLYIWRREVIRGVAR